MENGKHRYVVLLSTILTNAVTTGFVYGTSRLMPLQIQTFKATRTEISMLAATYSAVFSGVGVVTGTIVQLMGPKVVGLAAALVIGISISASFFVESVVQLIVCQSIITATASSALSISCSIVVSETFKGKRQMLALSFVSGGAGLSGMIYSYVLEALSIRYGLFGTYLVAGAITLNAFAFVLTWPCKNTRVTKEPAQQDASKTDTDTQHLQNTLLNRIKRLVCLKTFVLLAIGLSVTATALTTSLTSIADMLAGREEEQYAFLAILLFNMFSVFKKLLPGLLLKIPQSSALAVPFISTGCSITGCLLLAFAKPVPLFLIACCLNGLAFGNISACFAVTTVKVVGKDILATAMGCVYTLNGLVTLAAGPINGFIRDTTGRYTMVFLCAVMAQCTGGIFFIVAKCTRKRNAIVQASPVS